MRQGRPQRGLQHLLLMGSVPAGQRPLEIPAAAHIFNGEHSGSPGGAPVGAVPEPRVQRVLDTSCSRCLHRLATHHVCSEAAKPRNQSVGPFH